MYVKGQIRRCHALNRNYSPFLADTGEWDRSVLNRPYSVKQIGPTSHRLILPVL